MKHSLEDEDEGEMLELVEDDILDEGRGDLFNEPLDKFGEDVLLQLL